MNKTNLDVIHELLEDNAFEPSQIKIPDDWKHVFDNLDNGIIPDRYPEMSDINTLNCHIRGVYNSRYSFPLISMDWVSSLVDDIIEDRKCLEVMCGSGLLSYAFELEDVNIIATDNNDWANENYGEWKECSFYNIEQIDAVEAVKKYGKDVDFIIMSWPPYLKSIANDVLITMREVNPNCSLIYIGEDAGGCTADDDFYENAHIVKDIDIQAKLIKINEIFQSFPGIHDRIFIVK